MGMHDPLNFPYFRHINRARRNAWGNADKWSSADWSNEMCGEAGEAANVVKKLRRIETESVRDSNTDSDELVNQLGLELADVIICVDLLAMYYDINLEAFLIHKFNHTSKKNGLEQHTLARTNSGFDDQGGDVFPK